MKIKNSLVTLLLIVYAIYWSFWSLMPTYKSDAFTEKVFSTDRALVHVKNLSKKPHAVGFKGHQEVRQYIVSELKKMGLETSLQEGYSIDDVGNCSKAVNILAHIKGLEPGNALLLLSHYDSSPHSSFGASDAGSGIATILEGVRTFLAQNRSPKNDIIILFSDAEEIGLNGANLFVKEHPWKKDVRLVLNFEARGSGGPSFMLLETNYGNAKLIEEFTSANPNYPVANSLAYSVYKMLPNDTDLTVFRKEGNIEGFNFAFIDDHFDYHTAKDTYERLDKETIAHQGSYLMPLLYHFSQTDLTNLKSLDDSIYFNIPFFKFVTYPYAWIWPMYALAICCFVLLLIYGFRRKTLHLIQVVKGFYPMVLVLLVNGVVGYYSWSILIYIYPVYKDILHGFTYNGYTYIFGFVFFSIAVCFWIYSRFKKIQTANLLVAPILLWLVICGLINHYLSGASFFIIPVFAVLVAFMVLINQKIPNPYLLTFLGLPALFIYAPLIKMFPVGLGLKMMVASTVLTTLTFLLLLPVFGFYKNKKRCAHLGFILFLGAIIIAHVNSGFSKDKARPVSLLYVLNSDTNTAKWATYDHVLSDWNALYLGENIKKPKSLVENTIDSKYSTNFSYISDAPLKPIPEMKVEKNRDTIIGNSRFLEICITPLRTINRLEVFTNTITIETAKVNGKEIPKYYLQNRKSGKLVSHYISNNEYTELQLRVPKDSILELKLYEASNDLLNNPYVTLPPRPTNSISKPFVLNDAILVTKTIRYE